MKERQFQQFKTRKARKQAMCHKGSKPYANQQICVARDAPATPSIASLAMAVIASAFTRKNRRGR